MRLRTGISASVPNTYAQGVATRQVGWGGGRAQPVEQPWVDGLTTTLCECGRVRLRSREQCPRCAVIESGLGPSDRGARPTLRGPREAPGG